MKYKFFFTLSQLLKFFRKICKANGTNEAAGCTKTIGRVPSSVRKFLAEFFPQICFAAAICLVVYLRFHPLFAPIKTPRQRSFYGRETSRSQQSPLHFCGAFFQPSNGQPSTIVSLQPTPKDCIKNSFVYIWFRFGRKISLALVNARETCPVA